MKAMGGTPRGETLVRNDGFGTLKQMFARGYEEGSADVSTFPEYVERPNADTADDVSITFAEETGKGFYDQVADAVEQGDLEPFFDFSRMPTNWSVPDARPLEGAR
jgi:hypothetical protein